MSEQPINCIEEDEIDLKELLDTILKYKKFIAIFTFITVLTTFIVVIMMPNVYKSEIILSPQVKSKNIGGGLSSLAAMAGINIGGSGDSSDPYVVMKAVLSDDSFYRYMIEKYNLIEKFSNPQNIVYPFGLKFKNKDDENKPLEEKIFELTKKLKKDVINISQDKKSSLITLSVTYKDRYLANDLVQLFLKEIINKVKENDLKEMKKQIIYYKKELANTNDVTLKEQLSKSLSALLQKEVFSNANEYYFVSKIVDSHVAYIKDKIKPKRALILVVSFITSLIIAIFIVFFREFLKNSNEETN